MKILLFLDVGGSMDDHILKVEKLFNAAKMFLKFKLLYFHNCLYEGVEKQFKKWKERFSQNRLLEHMERNISVYLLVMQQ